ncbi:MAG: response regulator [Planctomycetes bacterium]|nr:response regulator [Planctomycetota bacterium]
MSTKADQDAYDHDESIKRVCHDLRSPLNAIQGFNDQLQKTLEGMKDVPKGVIVGLDNIQDAVHGMEKIISEFAKGQGLVMPEEASVDYVNNTLSDQELKTLEQGKRIMYIEDNDINILVMEGMLSHLGHECIALKDGREVMGRLKEESPDMVFIDLNMPEINGRDVVQMIRSDAQYNDLPVIIISADISGDKNEEVLEMGAQEFVSKPVQLNKLGRLLLKYLGKGEVNEECSELSRLSNDQWQLLKRGLDNLSQIDTIRCEEISDSIDVLHENLASCYNILKPYFKEIEKCAYFGDNDAYQKAIAKMSIDVLPEDAIPSASEDL